MAISEFQHKNKYLTLIIGKTVYQFKPDIDKESKKEGLNGILRGNFKEDEIEKISKYDGVIRTK